MQTIDCELFVLVDASGDYVVGKDAEAAREAAEADIGPLADSEGFRLVKVVVKVPLPEVVELAGVAPAHASVTQGAATLAGVE